MKFEPAAFWNKKILKWENDKYFSGSKFLINIDVNSSVKTRMELARLILKDIVPGRTVLELGCGSALLMEDILSFGAQKYTGIDVSSVAIDAAKQRALKLENNLNVELLTKNINEIDYMKADICFSMGLFDWLSLEDIALLQQKIDSKYYLHSFSEKKELSLPQIFHKIYVYLLYGYKNIKYVPRYYTEAEMALALKNTANMGPEFFRHPGLSFGCFAYYLPKAIAVTK